MPHHGPRCRHLTPLVWWLALAGPGAAQVNVLTANYDHWRTNSNTQETQLTPSTVTPNTFGKIGSLPVDGQVYGQPLYVNGVAIPSQGTHNVVYIATEHNSVYAYDADSVAPPELLWTVNLGTSVPVTFYNTGYTDVSPEMGILGTPAIDPVNGVIYVVADTYDGAGTSFSLHALDLGTGAERMDGPVAINATVVGNGAGSTADGLLLFDADLHIQRPGLLLSGGLVYVAFGSHGDQGSWHGWLLPYNASDLHVRQTPVCISPNGLGGAIWQSGRGLAADELGNLYVMSGNGDYDGVSNYSESFLKFAPDLTLDDWYTPLYWQMLSGNDYDLSAGVALIPNTHMVVGGDKYGQLYLLNGDSMGGLDTGNSGAQVFPGVSFGMIFTFALWPRTGDTYIYLRQEGGALMAYQYANGAINTTPVSSTLNQADRSTGGVAVSANGALGGTGVVWEVTGDHSQSPPPGTLHAYDAGNLATELWNSGMNAAQDNLGGFVKFVPPTVANGRVYVATLSGTVVVYGELSTVLSVTPPPTVAAVTNAASYAENGVSPGELVTIFGAGLGPTPATGLELNAAGRVARDLADTQVLFDGNTVPVIYASPNQVSAVAPFGLSAATTQVQVVYQGQVSVAFPANVGASTPAIFALDGSGRGQAAALNHDYSINSAANPAPIGSVIVLYATGGGQTFPAGADGAVVDPNNLKQPVAAVTVSIGGQNAQVLYSGGAPGAVEGVLQINAQVPPGIATGSAVPVTIQIGTVPSQPGVTAAIADAP